MSEKNAKMILQGAKIHPNDFTVVKNTQAFLQRQEIRPSVFAGSEKIIREKTKPKSKKC